MAHRCLGCPSIARAVRVMIPALSTIQTRIQQKHNRTERGDQRSTPRSPTSRDAHSRENERRPRQAKPPGPTIRSVHRLLRRSGLSWKLVEQTRKNLFCLARLRDCFGFREIARRPYHDQRDHTHSVVWQAFHTVHPGLSKVTLTSSPSLPANGVESAGNIPLIVSAL